MTATVLPLPPELAKSRALHSLLEKAGEWVATLIDEYQWPTPVTVEWYPIANGEGETLIGARVTDGVAVANGLFRPTDLADEDRTIRRFNPVLRALIGSTIDEQERRSRLVTVEVA